MNHLSLDNGGEEFKKAVTHLREEYVKLQVGRANASLIETVNVEAYGTKQPIKALANISIPDPKTIQIQPWDKSVLGDIEKAINASGLTLNPVNDGVVVRINIPPLTEERRIELSKLVHKLAEDAKISIRHARQKIHDHIKQQERDNELTEDDARLQEKRLQEKIDQFNKEIDDLAKAKETDVMTV